MLDCVPGKDDMWKTSEHTEYTEKRRSSSVYSVVSQGNEIAAKLVAILEGRSETNTKLEFQRLETGWPAEF
jgi:hypothetical protein